MFLLAIVLPDAFLKSRNKVSKANAKRPTEHSQLHQIQPPLPPLDFAHVGLRFADSLGEFDLGQAGGLPLLAQERAEDLVLAGKRRFFHGGSSQIPPRNV